LLLCFNLGRIFGFDLASLCVFDSELSVVQFFNQVRHYIITRENNYMMMRTMANTILLSASLNNPTLQAV